MDMIEQQRKLFEELRQLDPGVIEDGVSDEAQYTSAAYRIMYVLKEVNGGSGWSLCDHLRGQGEKDFRKLCFRQQAGVCGCTGQWRNLEKAAGTLCA